ncbi:MAG: hypothetical protein IPK60_20425 [Sandaracinaceae bacterium]|nr:hypothetical protein [Sandaracinaceae bacterium]
MDRVCEALTRVLESLDAQTFEEVARKNADQLPAALRPKEIAAVRNFIKTTTDHPARLRTALNLIDLGETGLDGVVKDALAALSGGDMRNLGPHYIQPALSSNAPNRSCQGERVGSYPGWRGVLCEQEYWLPFATTIPDALISNTCNASRPKT